MKGKWMPHITAVMALVVFIVLGLASASAPEPSNISIDGVWDRGDIVITISGDNGVFTQVDPNYRHIEAFNTGMINIGDQNIRNIRRTGYNRFTGEFLYVLFDRNSSGAIIRYTGKEWRGCAITVSRDGTIMTIDDIDKYTRLSEAQPAAPPPLKIGSIGPGGGKIFYISEAGFTVQMLDPEENYTAHYLEIAHGIEGSAWLGVGRPHAWSNGQTDIAGTEAAIGTGRKNTALILAADPSAPAAKVCYEFSNNGFTDWFLASVDETREIERNAVVLGVGTGSFLWTSTQANSRNALNLGMRLEGISKSTTSTVWPIRAF